MDQRVGVAILWLLGVCVVFILMLGFVVVDAKRELLSAVEPQPQSRATFRTIDSDGHPLDLTIERESTDKTPKDFGERAIREWREFKKAISEK